MKVYCKRTYFEKNTNAFPVNGKEYGQNYVKWACGKIYECHEPKDYEKTVTYLIIKSELEESFWYPVNKKSFNKHFETLEHFRNKSIEQILKND